jgi:hypothetical protein
MSNREAYDACIEYAKEHQCWAVLNAMLEDGYDPNVNWIAMIEKWRKEQ